VKFSALARKECGPCPVFAGYTLALPYNWGKKHLSQGSRQVPDGRDLMYRNGRFLRVARTNCRRSRSPCFRGPGSTLGQRRHLPSCITKGLPTSANYESGESLSCRDLMWSVGVDAGSYLQILRLAILRAFGALVGNTLLNTTSRAQVIIILVTVTIRIPPTGQEQC